MEIEDRVEQGWVDHVNALVPAHVEQPTSIDHKVIEFQVIANICAGSNGRILHGGPGRNKAVATNGCKGSDASACANAGVFADKHGGLKINAVRHTSVAGDPDSGLHFQSRVTYAGKV
jgi:hypothetical protein